MRCQRLLALVVTGSAAFSAHADVVTLSAQMTVDNRFTAYISTESNTTGTAFLSGSSWPTVDSGSIDLSAAGTYYLHIFAEDLGRPAMFIGNFSLSDATATFSNGTQELLTDASTGDWTASLTGFGGADVGVVDLGANGTSPWGNFGPLGDARFIWATGNPSPLTAYFSTTINVVPAPASAAALVPGAFVAGRRRRR